MTEGPQNLKEWIEMTVIIGFPFLGVALVGWLMEEREKQIRNRRAR